MVSDGARGLQLSMPKQEKEKNTSQRRHLGTAALTEADSTIWVERGLLTQQTGFKTTAARLAWLNSVLPRGRLVRLKLF